MSGVVAPGVPPLLALRGVSKMFGGLLAVKQLDVRVDAGEIAAMIGPNGAGKSTVFNLITGIYPITGGTIEFAGQSLAGLKTFEVAQRGIARTFQNIRLFAFMSALDNVMTGAHAVVRTNLVDSLLHTGRQRREERRVEAEARELLRFVDLHDYAQTYASSLAYGLQRRLEIARALASKPKLLLLDEPAAGMNAREKNDLIALIERIRDSGVTVFLIEHDMQLVMSVSRRVIVLDYGEKIAEGSPESVRADPRVIEAYLGVPEDAA